MFERRQIAKGARVDFSITPEQRELLVSSVWLPPMYLDRLRSGRRDGDEIAVPFTLPELTQLAIYVAAEADRTESHRLAESLDAIYGRAVYFLDNYEEEDDGSEDEPFPPGFEEVPEDVRHSLLEIMQDPSIETAEQLQERLLSLARKYIRADDPRFGGLPLPNVLRLIEKGWTGPDAPIRLSEDLTLADLEHNQQFACARRLLKAFADAEGGVKATKSGKLNRRFLLEMLDVLPLTPQQVAYVREFYKAPKEENIWFVHRPRIILESAGLVQLRSGAFHATKAGKALLADEAAGKLFAKCFSGFFDRIDLAYFDMLPDMPELQQNLPFTIYALAQETGDWISLRERAQDLMLPFAHAVIPPIMGKKRFDTFLHTRLLFHLTTFGLTESRHEEQPDNFPITFVRKTRLFDRFFSFHFPD